MATLRIAEYRYIGHTGAQVGEEPNIAIQNVTFTTATQSAAFQSGSVQNTQFVRLISTADCYLLFGTNPTATASNGVFLPADTIEYFGVTPGHKVSVYDGSS